MKSIFKLSIFTLALLCWSGCSDDNFPVPQSSSVDARYSFSFAEDDFAPATIQFTNESLLAEGISSVTYTWNFGDGTHIQAENPSHVYTEPGDYTVSLVAKTGDDIDFVEKEITVRDPNALTVEIIFIDAGSLSINNLDGTAFDVDGFGTGLAYDDQNDKIYFTDADNGTLLVSNTDGSGKEIVVDGFGEPRDLALDIPNNMAYVADRDVHAIYAVSLENKTKQVLYDNASDGLGELPVGLDLHDGQLYATCVEIGAEAVWKGSVDGGGINRIIDFGAGGYGYGIALDPVNEKIYFDNTDASQILMANLDGTGIAPVVDTEDRVYGIVVDNTNAKIYWTERDSGNVYMADRDGSNQVTVGSGYTDPRGLIFIP